MDRLYELISSLKEEEQKQFRKYHTHKSNKERKDILVFNKVCRQGKYDSKEVVKQLYESDTHLTSKAHGMLRLRVKKSLEDYIHQQVKKDDTPLYINKLISIARFLHIRKKHSLSWSYLEKAEKIALEAEEYELLNQVYQYMIEYASAQPTPILDEVIHKERKNQSAAQETRSLNLALSVIQNQLSTYHNKVEKPHIEKIVKNALEKFGVHKVVMQKASQYYKMAMLVKVHLEEKNDYDALCKYMIRTLQDMEGLNLFNKYNYQYRVELQNVVCYAAARVGDYVTALKYIHFIEEENKAHPETDLLSIQSFMVKVACLGITGNIHEALKVLEYINGKYKKLYRNNDFFYVTVNVNLATTHFHLGNTGIARKHIAEVLNYPKRILRYRGLEVLFNCHAIECFLSIEEGDIDYATFRVNSIERKFKSFLKQAHNKRKDAFVKLLRYIINHQNPWKENKFKEEAWKFIALQPIYNPGPESISFNAWLYSKLENVPYSEGEYNKMIEERMKSGKLESVISNR